MCSHRLSTPTRMRPGSNHCLASTRLYPCLEGATSYACLVRWQSAPKALSTVLLPGALDDGFCKCTADGMRAQQRSQTHGRTMHVRAMHGRWFSRLESCTLCRRCLAGGMLADASRTKKRAAVAPKCARLCNGCSFQHKGRLGRTTALAAPCICLASATAKPPGEALVLDGDGSLQACRSRSE